MKKFALISSLFFIFDASATISDFHCVTAMPSTSVIMKGEEDGRKWLNVIHHNGTKLAPIHNGTVTLNDLEYILKRGLLMTKMGENIRVSFEPESCKYHEAGNYSCWKNNNTTIGSLPVNGYGIQTYSSESFLYGVSFREFHFKFYVNAEGQNLDMQMDYDLGSHECTFDQF
jgi:hypothetical protein